SNHGEVQTIDNLQEPLANVQREDFYNCIIRAVESLPERERMVLAFYYDKDLNLKQIGNVLGITESRVCQIRTQAMLKIQEKMPDSFL
ncbi:MAG: sigma-70 family RNA polymerase sigma factor, partial [Gammaproteobacteria bacterium]